MIVDHKHEYVFIAIPKTGSISIQFSLGHGSDIPEPYLYHQSISSVLAKYPEAISYFKFGFVRNPWSRILSLYMDFTKKRMDRYSAKVKHSKPLFSEFANFEDFCLRLGESGWMSDIFFRSQTECLGINRTNSLVNYIGRFERYIDDFVEICNRINLPDIKLEKHNIGNYDNTDYRKYYTDQSAEAIAKLYSEDIRLLNYTF